MDSDLPPEWQPEALRLAEEQWRTFRADIWIGRSRQRSQALRAGLIGRVDPNSFLMRSATRVAVPFVQALRRRGHGSNEPNVVEFPSGRAQLFTQLATATKSVTSEVGVLTAPSARFANEALGRYEFVVLVDTSDELNASVLDRAVACMREHDWDFITIDEADAGSNYTLFKAPRQHLYSNWSSEAAGVAVVFRSRALSAIGGFSANAKTALRHDAVLRMLEHDVANGHLDAVVAAVHPSSARYDDLVAATKRSMRRLHVRGTVRTDASRDQLVEWSVVPSKAAPSVAIVIPTRDRLDLLARCVEHIEANTLYPNYTITIVDNDSIETPTLRYFSQSPHRIVRAPGPFNYSAIINKGIAASDAEYIVTCNNDVVIESSSWLSELVAMASLPSVGVVGPYLADPDGTPQHEGVIAAPFPQHLRRDLNYLVPDPWLEGTREVSAVTGAVQLFRRSLWLELEGYDEGLAVTGNDVDFCLRAARDRGALTLYTPTVRLFHAESSSRGSLNPPADMIRLIARWHFFTRRVDEFFPAALELVGNEIRVRGDYAQPPAKLTT